jgi:hypothetical protein
MSGKREAVAFMRLGAAKMIHSSVVSPILIRYISAR